MAQNPDLSQALAFAHLNTFPGAAPGALAASAASGVVGGMANLRAGVKRPATTSLPSPIPSANHFGQPHPLGPGQRTSSPKVTTFYFDYR